MLAKTYQSTEKLTLWLGLVLCLIGIVFASQQRIAQFEQWHSAARASQPVPYSVATLDAYYYQRWAEEVQSASFVAHARDPLRHYQRKQFPGDPPMWSRYGAQAQWLPQLKPKKMPGPSRLLVWSAPFFDGDMNKAAVYLPPLLSSLFMLPLFFYCLRLGFPAAGIMAGLSATFSYAYFTKGGAGWLDTDSLNLFFPWLIALIMLLMNRERGTLPNLLLAMCAGITMLCYYAWYPRPGLAIMFLLSLVAYLFWQRLALTHIAMVALVFVICANPLQFLEGVPNILEFMARYLGTAPTSITEADAHYPNVMNTVAEVGQNAWHQVIAATLQPTSLAYVGLAAFLVLGWQRWRQMIPLVPLLVLATLPFISSHRFSLYLAPFVGLGLGYLICVLVQRIQIGRTAKDNEPRPQGSANVASYVVVAAFFLAFVLPESSADKPFRPALPLPVIAAVDELGRTLPSDARLWTWWDIGFMIPAVAGRAVYHDGGAQQSPQTFFVARSLTSSQPDYLRNIASFVDGNGNRGIQAVSEKHLSVAGAVRAISETGTPLLHNKIHILFTMDMIPKYAAIHHLGNWQFADTSSQRGGYESLLCTGRRGNTLQCGDEEINLSLGSVGDRVLLKRTEMINNGRFVQKMDYPRSDSDWYLQILTKDNKAFAVYLLNAATYHSNFNQMYLRGNYDTALFEEVYNNFPAARVFRVKPG